MSQVNFDAAVVIARVFADDVADVDAFFAGYVVAVESVVAVATVSN